jgi:hypothetical protein
MYPETEERSTYFTRLYVPLLVTVPIPVELDSGQKSPLGHLAEMDLGRFSALLIVVVF